MTALIPATVNTDTPPPMHKPLTEEREGPCNATRRIPHNNPKE